VLATRSGAARLGLLSSALLGLLEPIALAFQGEDLGAVEQPIDDGAHATGIGKDLIPFTEQLVGRQENGTALLVATGDDFEEQIGVVVAAREISELVQDQDFRPLVVPQAAFEWMVVVFATLAGLRMIFW
jgi:hypothetical protein